MADEIVLLSTDIIILIYFRERINLVILNTLTIFNNLKAFNPLELL